MSKRWNRGSNLVTTITLLYLHWHIPDLKLIYRGALYGRWFLWRLVVYHGFTICSRVCSRSTYSYLARSRLNINIV